jgi:hypothetical protein
MRPVRSFVTVPILAIAAVSASAQPILSVKSGVIAGVEGKVLIDNQEVQQSVTHFPEVKEGSVLRTEYGRVELMLPPGFMLRMGENGALKMLSNRLIDTRVELQAGSAVVEVDQTKLDYNVTIALKDGLVTLSKVGVFRFDSDPARLKVFHGMATAEVGGQSVAVATGKMLALTGGAATVEKFDVTQTDALDNWSQRHAEAMAMANLSGAKYSNDSYSSPVGNTWVYNPYYGMYSYMPMMGTMCNPFYGLCFYSPLSAYQAFYYGPMAYGYGYPMYAYGYAYGYGYGNSMFGGGVYTSMHGNPSSPSVFTSHGSGSSGGSLFGGTRGGGGMGGGGMGGGSVGGGSVGGGSIGSSGIGAGHGIGGGSIGGGGTGGHGGR